MLSWVELAVPKCFGPEPYSHMALFGVWWGSYTFAAGAMVGLRPIF